MRWSESISVKRLRLGPRVAHTGKLICIGLNYADHAAEVGMQVPPEPVVFNKRTSAICGPDDAMQHVAGYCIINGVSEREYQLERSGTWDKGKGCDTLGPTAPWRVIADEIAAQKPHRFTCAPARPFTWV